MRTGTGWGSRAQRARKADRAHFRLLPLLFLSFILFFFSLLPFFFLFGGLG